MKKGVDSTGEVMHYVQLIKHSWNLVTVRSSTRFRGVDCRSLLNDCKPSALIVSLFLVVIQFCTLVPVKYYSLISFVNITVNKNIGSLTTCSRLHTIQLVYVVNCPMQFIFLAQWVSTRMGDRLRTTKSSRYV